MQQVDVLYAGIDNLILENIKALINIANENTKPVISGESGAVRKGALLAISIDMYTFGRKTADMAAKDLRGQPPGDIPIGIVEEGRLFANSDTAKYFGVFEALRNMGAEFVSRTERMERVE